MLSLFPTEVKSACSCHSFQPASNTEKTVWFQKGNQIDLSMIKSGRSCTEDPLSPQSVRLPSITILENIYHGGSCTGGCLSGATTRFVALQEREHYSQKHKKRQNQDHTFKMKQLEQQRQCSKTTH